MAGRALGLDIRPPAGGTPGDPGLFGPGSMIWRVGRERVLLAAGPTALLLQVAHPLVAEAVAHHSGFRQDPFARLRATLHSVLTISFGDRAQARAAAERVNATHRRVRGHLASGAGPFPPGTPYDATDPDLAMWVHATLVHKALESFALLIASLTRQDRERYYEQAKPFAELFGVPRTLMPPTYFEFRDYVDSMVSGRALSVGEEARGLAEHILHPPLPPAMKPAAAIARILATGLLPGRLRQAFSLPWGAPQRALLAGTARTVRATVSVLPPATRFWPHYQVARRRIRGDRG